jgi:superfamily II DNA/RNA helicase
MGFIDQVEAIINAVPVHRSTMLFSATLPEAVENLCSKYMNSPVRIEINPKRLTVEGIEQSYFEVPEDKKFDLLNRILYIEKPDRCILFCRTRDNTKRLAAAMMKINYPCRELHGGMLQDDRLRIMDSFKMGEFMFLVSTDIAARGIDVEHITHIINYDLPVEVEAYVHRIGRTARAGGSGKAISLVTPNEARLLKEIEAYIGMEIPRREAPSAQEAQNNREEFLKKIKSKPVRLKRKASELDKGIMKLYIGAGKKKKIRPGDIVGAISAIDGVSAENVGIIDIQDNVSYVEILDGKGKLVLDSLKDSKIKGKAVRVEKAER